jgi:hypothetical protein
LQQLEGYGVTKAKPNGRLVFCLIATERGEQLVVPPPTKERSELASTVKALKYHAGVVRQAANNGDVHLQPFRGAIRVQHVENLAELGHCFTARTKHTFKLVT